MILHGSCFTTHQRPTTSRSLKNVFTKVTNSIWLHTKVSVKNRTEIANGFGFNSNLDMDMSEWHVGTKTSCCILSHSHCGVCDIIGCLKCAVSYPVHVTSTYKNIIVDRQKYTSDSLSRMIMNDNVSCSIHHNSINSKISTRHLSTSTIIHSQSLPNRPAPAQTAGAFSVSESRRRTSLAKSCPCCCLWRVAQRGSPGKTQTIIVTQHGRIPELFDVSVCVSKLNVW